MKTHLFNNLALAVFASAFSLSVFAGQQSELALQLFSDGEYGAAALEFRRLALSADKDAETAAWYWMSAYSYAVLSAYDLADSCMDRAEEADEGGSLSLALSELRADISYECSAFREAAFYYGSLYKKADDPLMKDYAAEGIVASLLFTGNMEASLASADNLSPARKTAVLDALGSYRDATKKKPWLGGLLGIIPGCGHFYSGEYANGIRSLLLNGIFIYGMAQTAHDDCWGAFAAITFFELTWYSGSIYGGIDAAERYNNNLLLDTIGEIRSISSPQPDRRVLPVISFGFEY